MKKEIFKNLMSIPIVGIIVFFSTYTFAGDFQVDNINPNWESEYFGELPYRSACLAFDSDNNLYANDLITDFYEDHYEIYTYSAPNYNFNATPTLHATMEKTFEVISGLNFDKKGNLYVSEVISSSNYIGYEYPNAGLIRKISANTKSLSDPVIYLSFRPTGIAVLSPHIVYFPGRKRSDPYWGNIYKISNFESNEQSNNPIIDVDDAVCTAIATDRWGTIFVAPRWDTVGWTVYARNPYNGSFEWIATFSKLMEELTFDADGNLYAIEDTENETEIIKLIPTNIVINGCDTKIIDWPIDGGTRISDIIDGCDDNSNHDEFVSCVARSANQLVQDGYISGKQLAAIVTCAAQADNF
jgi:hypothetical protein